MQSNNKTLEEQISDLQEENASLQALVNEQDGGTSSEEHSEPSPSSAPQTSETKSQVASSAPSQMEPAVINSPAPVVELATQPVDSAPEFLAIHERISQVEEAVANIGTQQATANAPSEPLEVTTTESIDEGLDLTVTAFTKELGESL